MKNWLNKLEDVDCELEWVSDIMETVCYAYENKQGDVKSCTFSLPTQKLFELRKRLTEIVNEIYAEQRVASNPTQTTATTQSNQQYMIAGGEISIFERVIIGTLRHTDQGTRQAVYRLLDIDCVGNGGDAA